MIQKSVKRAVKDLFISDLMHVLGAWRYVLLMLFDAGLQRINVMCELPLVVS